MATSEEYKKRTQLVMDRFLKRPAWRKKRLTKDYAFETWKKQQEKKLA